MFNRLPNILGRNFLIGYFLPSVLLVLISYCVGLCFINSLNWNFFIDQGIDLNVLLTCFLLLSLIVAVFLLSINMKIIRFMEGHGSLNPFKLIGWFEKCILIETKYQFLQKDREARDFYSKNQKIPVSIIEKRCELARKLVIRFPIDDLSSGDYELLPTSFGNTIRAFEVYVAVMYGVDPISAWIRLISLIPPEYLTLIEDSKSMLDLWVNIWFGSVLITIEYFVFLLYLEQIKNVWIILTTIIVMFFAYENARMSAELWGDFIKSSFDLFLPSLRDKLDLNCYSRESWAKFSEAIVYRKPQLLSSLLVKNVDKDGNISSVFD